MKLKLSPATFPNGKLAFPRSWVIERLFVPMLKALDVLWGATPRGQDAGRSLARPVHAAEDTFNKLPHFTTPIEAEVHLHLSYVKSSVLFCSIHNLETGGACPANGFVEASKVLPFLTSRTSPAHGVVVHFPPGFGFSKANIRPRGPQQVHYLGR